MCVCVWVGALCEPINLQWGSAKPHKLYYFNYEFTQPPLLSEDIS